MSDRDKLEILTELVTELAERANDCIEIIKAYEDEL